MSVVSELIPFILPMQTDGAAAAPMTDIQSLFDFVKKGGPMMYPIGLCSLFALAVLAERLISLRRRAIIPPGFLPGLKKVLAQSGGDRDKALDYCRKRPSPVANVFAAGIRKLGASEELIERHINEAGAREVLKLRKNLRVLSVVAAISPLLGLLGTIFGMIEAFETVSRTGEALGKTEMLAGGIYEAMITTAAGLVVAIPALIFYHWMSARVERLVMEIDQMSVAFLEDLPSLEIQAAEDADRQTGAIPAAGPGNLAVAAG